MTSFATVLLFLLFLLFLYDNHLLVTTGTPSTSSEPGLYRIGIETLFCVDVEFRATTRHPVGITQLNRILTQRTLRLVVVVAFDR